MCIRNFCIIGKTNFLKVLREIFSLLFNIAGRCLRFRFIYIWSSFAVHLMMSLYFKPYEIDMHFWGALKYGFDRIECKLFIIPLQSYIKEFGCIIIERKKLVAIILMILHNFKIMKLICISGAHKNMIFTEYRV